MKFLIFITLFFNLLYSSTLYLSTSSNPSRLNPILATDSASSQIASFIFNGLVKYDENLTNIVGDLAKRYYFKDDVTLIFELRDNVFWHDGVKFNADDVVFTYNTIVSDKIASAYSSNFRFVKSVKALDDYKVEVKYVKPYFKAVEIWMMGILPKHILESEKNLMSSSFNTHPIGTGAYKLKRLEFSKNILLQANSNYFEAKPKIDTISFSIIPDSSTRFLMLKSNKLDVGSLDALTYDRKLSKKFLNDFNIYEKISNSYTYLGFNLRRKKFQDKRVREALSLAINRDELVDILFFKHATVCTGPFLPSTKAFNKSIKAPKQNIKRAKELLKEAGYDSKNPLVFEIATSNSNSIRPYAAQILQYQLQKVGVKVKLRIMEWQAFLNMVVFPHNFDTVLLGWGLSVTPDPFMIWHSSNSKRGGFNFIGYKNEKLDHLIELSQKIVDRDKLAKLWQEMFKIIVEDNPYLFLYIPNEITAVSKSIKNVRQTPSGVWEDYIKWEKR